MDKIPVRLQELKRDILNNSYYRGRLKNVSIVSCFGDNPEAFAAYIFKKFNSHIALVVNVDKKTVHTFTNYCSLDASKIAKLICGKSTDHVGEFTPKFLTFCKDLTRCQ